MSKEPKRNVYVGHRYVPKIMGEWDKTETYEGLSIVTNKGTSYTSKKRVPKGIDILNEEYWVVTGNYNAQIEEYRGDVSRIKKDMTDLETDLTKDMTDLETVLTADMSSFKNEVNNEVESKTNTIRNETKESINKLKESFNNVVINVKDLGAKGDGKTENFDIFQQALDKVESLNGGYVFIPQGHYKIGGRLEIGSNVTLIGTGNGSILDAYVSSVIEQKGSGLIINKGYNKEENYSGASNFSIQKIAITSSDEQRQGIYLEGAKDYYISDITSFGTCKDHWFDINNTKNGLFERLTLNKPRSSIFQLDVKQYKTTGVEYGIGNDNITIRDVYMTDQNDQSNYVNRSFEQSGFHFHDGSCKNIYISNLISENVHTLFFKDEGIDISNISVRDVNIKNVQQTFFFEHGSDKLNNKQYNNIFIENIRVVSDKIGRGIGWFASIKDLYINNFYLEANEFLSAQNGFLSIDANAENINLENIDLKGHVFDSYKNVPIWEHDYFTDVMKKIIFKSLKDQVSYEFKPIFDGVNSGYSEQLGKVTFVNGIVKLNIRLKHDNFNSSAEYFAIKNLPTIYFDKKYLRNAGIIDYLNNDILNDQNNYLVPYINNSENGIRIRKNYTDNLTSTEINNTSIELNIIIEIVGEEWEK